MSDVLYYLLCGGLLLGVMAGIAMLSRVKTAPYGNGLSALCMAAAILLVMRRYELVSLRALWICLAIGLILGLWGAVKVKMIQMPQTVALLNGFGGAASALVAAVYVWQAGPGGGFFYTAAAITLAIGWFTFSGSLIAAGKLHNRIRPQPLIWPGHSRILILTLAVMAALICLLPLWRQGSGAVAVVLSLVSLFFGVAFALRIGGADMPVAISLLNALSGTAGAVAGMTVNEPLLVAVGGVVGASGILLTQIMCRGMNRRLPEILTGATVAVKPLPAADAAGEAAGNSADSQLQAGGDPAGSQKPADDASTDRQKQESGAPSGGKKQEADVFAALRSARQVIIVPGYGMALAQAQHLLKKLSDALEQRGAEVKFAIHPVAGRMPGHMNVLLCEADVPYGQLYEMQDINEQFAHCDIAVAVGANDVINPAANTAEGTPIYGMPVLQIAGAPLVAVCNFDRKPGYAGVENPLYDMDKTVLFLGDAKESLAKLLQALDETV
ncbi:MAG: NAD(P)(+) transhydrogenase (Re/Si-specific) subunit beta [Firmicutes bacterium]|nr:NAD(P)(+) transhydrogenase (Re/Si-specific) subunit beta [Bacillota bacterium]